jgi:hypothetical protein
LSKNRKKSPPSKFLFIYGGKKRIKCSSDRLEFSSNLGKIEENFPLICVRHIGGNFREIFPYSKNEIFVTLRENPVEFSAIFWGKYFRHM